MSTQYFPSVSWINFFLRQQEVAIDQWENYQKQGLMNRCKILGAEGIITLSVPLIGGREQKNILKEVLINNNTNWANDQLRTIKSCYGRAPFFDYYFEPLEMLLNKKHSVLLDLNMEALQLILGWLKHPVKPLFTNSFEEKKVSINSHQQEIELPLKYLQIFNDRLPFTPGLSVLDLLFCTGPQAGTLFAG